MLVHHQSQVALGCKVTLLFVSGAGKSVIDDRFRQLWLEIFEFEQRCSRFLPGSELSQFNKTAGIRKPISSELRNVLLAAKRMAVVTGGLYNPFVLPALQREGYIRSMLSAHAQDAVDDYSDRQVVPADSLTIGNMWAMIPHGTAIDLGGSGKGYIADQIADRAESFPEINGYWFSLGGDVVAGGLDENDQPWAIQIESARATNGNDVVGSVILPGPSRRSLATSSAIRSAPKISVEHRHIIDPRTNRPADTDIELATVYAEKALITDVMASCAIIVGSKQAKNFLSKSDVLGALLQTGNNRNIVLGALRNMPAFSTRERVPSSS